MNVPCEFVCAPPKNIAEKLQHRVSSTLSEHTRNGEIASRSLAVIFVAYKPGYKYSDCTWQRARGVSKYAALET